MKDSAAILHPGRLTTIPTWPGSVSNESMPPLAIGTDKGPLLGDLNSIVPAVASLPGS